MKLYTEQQVIAECGISGTTWYKYKRLGELPEPRGWLGSTPYFDQALVDACRLYFADHRGRGRQARKKQDSQGD